MNPSGNPDDPTLNDLLLSKADALIRRNRPDGVGTDAEELPLLTDAVEDLPELTDAVEAPARAEDSARLPDTVAPHNTPQNNSQDAELVELTLDLEDLEDTPREEPRPRFIEEAVREVEERTRAELEAAHEQALEELRTQLQAEAAAEQAKAIEAALAQHRQDAEATQRARVDEARRDAWQTAAMAMSEHLIDLDSYLAQSLDQWMTTELPQLVSTEMAGMVERLRSRASAHLRATLVPQLSEKLSSVLDETLSDNTSSGNK